MDAYELLGKEHLDDLDADGYIYSHKKSGARVIVIKNDDKNKVFSIAFRTPSTGSTGVQHITEHSTLCGSKKYPAKDPFVELAKGSLNTFLNAMTYPDKTVYPVASCNDTDYKNLMDVYLDAVFYPNIYERPEIFKQEGWHYESDGENVKYNGVVFNEMKGAYSSPDDVLENGIFSSLFPESPYRFDSGGDPEVIPTLTYEDFIEFHKNHYHPANSYIYMYGDIDAEERLEYLDKEYLGAFNKDDFTFDTAVPEQKGFDVPVKNTFNYSILPEEGTDEKAYLSYSWIVDTALNAQLCIAMDVLDYCLVLAPGAKLKQTLIDRGIATDISSSFETSLYQPVYTITAKNADPAKEDEFLAIIEEVLSDILENGIDEEMAQAGINFFEFRYREADFGTYPKGLIYNLAMLDSWIYDDSRPFIHIDSGKIFDLLKTVDIQTFFKDIIRTYLTDNKTAACVTLIPDTTLDEKRVRAEQERIDEYISGLSQEEKNKIYEDTISLKAYQDEESSKEDLEKIPLLSLEDIDKEPVLIEYEESELEGVKYIKEDIFTSGIAYVTLAFDCDTVPEKYLPYMGLLNIVIGLMDTENYSYAGLTNAINKNTGGIFTDISIRRNVVDYSDMRIFFDIKSKALYGGVEKMADLTKEMIFRTDFSDKKRLKDIMAKTQSQLEDSVLSAGHTTAASLALSQFSNSRHYGSVMRGYEFFRFLQESYRDFDARADEIIDILNELVKIIFNKNNLIINITADGKGFAAAEKPLKSIIEDLPDTQRTEQKREFEKGHVNRARTSAAQVNYVARAGNFKNEGIEYTGALRVLKTIFSYEYLWMNVRVKGGAYGCMSEFGRSGDAFMVSYRDPNIKETNEIFENASDFVKGFTVDRRDMDKYIIGTIGTLDTPLTPSAKGSRAFDAYLKNMTNDILRQERKEILDTDQETIRGLHTVVDAVLKENYLCVVGNSEKIAANKEMFDEIKPLV